MVELSCDQVRDLGAELALGVVDGRQRALALDHLEHCPACREEAARLAETADQLFQLAPSVEPPVGFDEGVMRRLARSRPRSRRRVWIPAAAAAVVVAAGLTGWTARSHTISPPGTVPTASRGPGQAVVLAAAFTAGDHRVGMVYAYAGRPSWMYMTVDVDGTPGPVSCQLLTWDGTIVPIGNFALASGYGYWGAPSPVSAVTLRGARLVDTTGSVVASAAFRITAPA